MGDRIDAATLGRLLRLKGIGPSVVERVLKLNPHGAEEGQRVRGLQRSTRFTPSRWVTGMIGKREFVTKHGREAWDAIPNGLKLKYGRRKYVSRETFLDNLHLAYTGKTKTEYLAHFPTKRYANDPLLTVEMRPR